MGLRLAVDLGFDQRSINVTRADRIAGDALLGGLKRRNLGQADDAVLRGDIGRLERRCDQPVCGRDIDNSPKLVLAHRRQRRPHRMKRRRQVDRQDRVPFLDRKMLERSDMLDAGIVDQDIEPPVTGDGSRDHLGDRITAGHVGRGIADLDAEIGSDLIAGFGDLGRDAETVQHHRGTRFRQRTGNPEPDATGRTRDKRGLARQRPQIRSTLRFELDIHGRPFLWGFSALR